MKLHFLGANRQVTGSRYCLEAAGRKILVDCGLVQEREYLARNWDNCPIPAGEIDAVVLTHAHIDHCGLIPKFVREGFRASIYATRPTEQLLNVMLRDAARIQVEDARYKKRRHKREHRRGAHPEIPLFDEADVDRALPLVRSVAYQQPLELAPGLTVAFHDAGHILGSAMLLFTVSEAGRQQRIVFSGDIGQHDKPLIRDPTYFEAADYVVMESTYGDRNHENGGDIAVQLADVLNKTLRRGGNVVIPTFAVERAQELMYYIGRLVHADRIPDVKVYLDSPMAVDVTKIFRRCRDSFDRETWELINSREPPLQFPGLHMTRSQQESQAINDAKEPCIIMAASGMCTSGRIKHHLRHNVGRPESTILFVGYQGRGTLGRRILEGEPQVRIHGRNWRVRAEVAQIYGFSGHADREGLARWAAHFRTPPRRLFLTHGDLPAAESLAQLLKTDYGYDVSIPGYLDAVELNAKDV